MATEVELRKGMELTPRQIAESGAIEVMRMAFKLCYRSPLLAIQFAIVQPVCAAELLFGRFQPRILDWILPPPTTPATSLVNWLLMRLLLTSTTTGLLFCVDLVVLAAIFSGAGSVILGKDMTVAEVLRSVPRLWWRLFVTQVYGLLLMALVSVPVITFSLTWLLAKSNLYWSIFLLLLGCVSMIPLYVLFTLSSVAVSVTCYEERYGWAAYTQALKLLRAKWKSGLLLYLMSVILAVSSAFVGLPVVSAKSLGWSELVSGVAFVLIASWVLQLIRVAWAVFYFSCTEVCQQQQATYDMEVGYQRLATETVK